ncbi:MAG: F0F1 ATP synthase subunit B [Gammaproteobacteria bacterium]|nr:F0F1 ATP synthase subunit B [Gammaproteobacteria bacterium]
MNVTATLFGQMITFAVMVAFVWRFLWGPLTRMLAERSRRIADGLAAAEKGRHDLERAQKRAVEVLREARQQANEILAQAEKRAGEIIDEAKTHAKGEAEGIISAARTEIEREANAAREQLRVSASQLAVAAAERILEHEIDAAAHARLIGAVVQQL